MSSQHESALTMDRLQTLMLRLNSCSRHVLLKQTMPFERCFQFGYQTENSVQASQCYRSRLLFLDLYLEPGCCIIPACCCCCCCCCCCWCCCFCFLLLLLLLLVLVLVLVLVLLFLFLVLLWLFVCLFACLFVFLLACLFVCLFFCCCGWCCCCC